MSKIKFILPWLCIALISILSSYFFSYYLPNKRSMSLENNKNADKQRVIDGCISSSAYEYNRQIAPFQKDKDIKYFPTYDAVNYNTERGKCFFAYHEKIFLLPSNTSYTNYKIIDTASKETVLTVSDFNNPNAEAQYLTLRYLLLRE